MSVGQKKRAPEIHASSETQQPFVNDNPGNYIITDSVWVEHKCFNSLIEFTGEEWRKFEKRVEEGYDFPPEGRYYEWLDIYYPELLQKSGMTT